MAHTIIVYGSCDELVSRDQIRELIEMNYLGREFPISMIVGPCPGEKKKFSILAGLHIWNGLEKKHTIYVDPSSVKKMFELGRGVGGNKRPIDMKHAIVSAIVHEVQHANQILKHKAGHAFYSEGKYVNRACERDARGYVDERYDELAVYLGLSLPEIALPPPIADEETYEEICQIAECFQDIGSVTLRDLTEELRNSRINTLKNLDILRKLLVETGVEIKTR